MAVKEVLAGLVIAAEATVRHVVGFILLQGAGLERTTNDNQSINRDNKQPMYKVYTDTLYTEDNQILLN